MFEARIVLTFPTGAYLPGVMYIHAYPIYRARVFGVEPAMDATGHRGMRPYAMALAGP